MAKRSKAVRPNDGATRAERRKLYNLARQVRDQSVLNDVLFDIPNQIVRREVFYLIRPMLKFEATYPEWLAKVHRRE